MIFSANTITLDKAFGGLPNISSAIVGWMKPISMEKAVKQLEDGEIREFFVSYVTKGVIQPLTHQQLSLKPEGQRAWAWKMLHASTDLVLKPDDAVIISGVRSRVMAKWDYSDYGYISYELVEDYTTPNGS